MITRTIRKRLAFRDAPVPPSPAAPPAKPTPIDYLAPFVRQLRILAAAYPDRDPFNLSVEAEHLDRLHDAWRYISSRLRPDARAKRFCENFTIAEVPDESREEGLRRLHELAKRWLPTMVEDMKLQASRSEKWKFFHDPQRLDEDSFLVNANVTQTDFPLPDEPEKGPNT